MLRKRYVNWGSSWRYLSLKEIKEFLKDFTACDIKTTGVLGTFGRIKVREIYYQQLTN